MTALDPTVRALAVLDVTAAAALHRIAYPEDHLTSRLPETLTRAMYEALLPTHPYSYGAFDDHGRLVGLVICGAGGAPMSALARKEPARVAHFAAHHPGAIARMLMDRVRGHRVRSAARIRLLNVLVDPTVEGQGVARRLVAHLEAELRAAGIRLYGTSVRRTNQRNLAFNRDNGAAVEAETSTAVYFIKHL